MVVMNPKNVEYVTASELGDFTFCKRGWWLKKNGLLPPNEAMAKGVQNHETLANEVTSAQLLKKIAISLLLTGLLIVLVVIILTMFL